MKKFFAQAMETDYTAYIDGTPYFRRVTDRDIGQYRRFIDGMVSIHDQPALYAYAVASVDIMELNNVIPEVARGTNAPFSVFINCATIRTEIWRNLLTPTNSVKLRTYVQDAVAQNIDWGVQSVIWVTHTYIKRDRGDKLFEEFTQEERGIIISFKPVTLIDLVRGEV